MTEATQVKSWVEEVTFAECPNNDCGETQDLGSGLVWEGPIEWQCEECGAEFLVAPPARESKA